MTLKMFAIYDVKGQFFSQPFVAATNAAGMRQFGDLVNNPNTLFAAHPKDYALYEIGSYDDQTADLQKHKTNTMLAMGNDFIQKPVGSITPEPNGILQEAVQ